MARAKKFKYPYATTRPPEVSDWEDQSWRNDASASCVRRAPTAKHQKGGFRLWVQADDKSEREFQDEPVFQLDWVRDIEVSDWNSDLGDRTLLSTDSIAEVMAAVAKGGPA